MLKEKHVKQKPHNYEVLILILMEHAQRVKPGDLEVNFQES